MPLYYALNTVHISTVDTLPEPNGGVLVQVAAAVEGPTTTTEVSIKVRLTLKMGFTEFYYN